MSKKLFISSFSLKIIALILMTIDHVGLLLQTIYPSLPNMSTIYNVLRGMGRLALPLFVFMIVEGVMHTKNFKKYIIRLSIFALIISLALIIATYVPIGYDASALTGAGNIFLDLTLAAIAVYLISQKDWKLKLITLLPIAVSIISFCVKGYEISSRNAVLWYPNWLYLQYDWVSIFLAIGIYYAKVFSKKYIEYFSNKNGIDPLTFEIDGTPQLISNTMSWFVIFTVQVVYYLVSIIWPSGTFWDASTQLIAIFSGVFILFYSGKRGYNSKVFQYGCYIYYPLHLVIIILLAILL